MKWLIGILLVLNIFVFLLANLGGENGQAKAKIDALPANTAGIRLLDSGVEQLPGNCANIGPVELASVLDRFEKVLAAEKLSYRVISEAARKVSAYRVVIPIENSSSLDDLRQRLQTAGISEIYEKTLAGGQRVLSLGVFTYKNTATDLAGNLNNTGFAARIDRELLDFPQRYWINLDQPVTKGVLNDLNQYTGTAKVVQSAYKCL